MRARLWASNVYLVSDSLVKAFPFQSDWRFNNLMKSRDNEYIFLQLVGTCSAVVQECGKGKRYFGLRCFITLRTLVFHGAGLGSLCETPKGKW